MEVSLFSTSQYIRAHTNGSLFRTFTQEIQLPLWKVFNALFLIYNFALPLKSVSLLKKCVLSGGQIQSRNMK